MKKVLFLAATLLCSFVTAQNVTLKGVVKDSLGSPLELANIIATRAVDGAMENYAIADSKGEFRISLPEKKVYLFTISYLGMKPLSREIDLTGQPDPKDLEFILFPDENQLDGVELKYEMPVVVRGDTIVYNTGSFTNGTERKLGDVLKKLPGIQVNEDGEIEVEGKKVSKVMVEGKDFFDGDSKLATKNIPADALNKVEVLRNYNEVNQMRGLGNDQDNVAINIKLKEGKKNFWFGEVEGGLGEGEGLRYLGSSKLFYYSTNTSLNFIGNANNTGDVPFTFRDYINFTGGFRNFNSGGGTSFNTNDGGLGFLITQNDRANELITRFGAANFTHTISKSWNMSGFSIYSDNRVDLLQQSMRNFLQTNATEFSSSDSDQRNRLGMAKFSTTYKPSARFQMDHDLLLKKSRQEELTNVISIFNENGNEVINPIAEVKENEPFSVHQNLNMYYTAGAKNIFAGYLRHLFQEEDPFYNAISRVQPFTNILPLSTGEDAFNINQKKNVMTNKLDARLDYYHIINNLSNININIGSTLSRQQFDSYIFQLLDNGTTNLFENRNLVNDVEYNFRDLFVGARYKIKKGIFTFTPGLTLHNYEVETLQQGQTTAQNTTLLLPNFFTIAQFRQSESLQFNYQMTADFTDVNNFAEAYVFNNYNRLFRGNRNLENAIYHTASLNYYNFSMYNFTNINAGINYNRRINPIRNSTVIENINQVNTVINSNFPDETWSGNARYQKTFRRWKANLESSLSLSNFNVIVNGLEQQSRSFTQHYQGSAETNFRNAPNFEVGYSRSTNMYNNAGVENTFYTDRPFANVELIFLKSFTFTADYSYYNYRNRENTIENQYGFLNASLFYRKPESKWEFKLNATNLLNVDSINRDSFNELFNITTEYFVQPRILMASIKYHL